VTAAVLRTQLLVWVAQGLGSGRLPGAPGTWGSLLGLAWFGLLAATGHPLIYAGASLVLLGIAIPVCSRAEQVLQTTDPASVVLDEIVAVPLCYAGWILCDWLREGTLPVWSSFFTGSNLVLTLVGFGLFRLLDAWKPFPIDHCQRLPAGWGIVADDVAAGLIAGAVVGVLRWVWP
jgi:phosphatidylglycerophosphatase A